MASASTPCIVRLNARTMPMTAAERDTLAVLAPRVVELEGGTDDEVLAAREGVTAVAFATVLAESDYLCLLCPLLPSTRGMLALPQFRTMKPTAVLVNTGRGELVDEDDLVTALREGIIRYAALDVFGAVNVFAVDGFSTEHPLFSLDNVLLSPHMAAASVEASGDCRRRGAQAVVDVLSGKWPEHPLNPEVTPWFPRPAPSSAAAQRPTPAAIAKDLERIIS